MCCMSLSVFCTGSGVTSRTWTCQHFRRRPPANPRMARIIDVMLQSQLWHTDIVEQFPLSWGLADTCDPPSLAPEVEVRASTVNALWSENVRIVDWSCPPHGCTEPDSSNQQASGQRETDLTQGAIGCRSWRVVMRPILLCTTSTPSDR